MGRHQHHAELGRGEHHRHVHVAGQLRQPLGVPGIGEARQVEGVLVRGRGDDRVHLALQRQLDRRLDGVPGEPPRPDHSRPVLGPLAAPQPPGSHADPPGRGNRRDLVLRPDDRDLRRRAAPPARAR